MQYFSIFLFLILMIISSSLNTSINTKNEKANNLRLLQEQKEKNKFCFILLHDESSTYDKNFYDSAKKACEDLGVEPIIKTDVPESEECYNIAKELGEKGCKGIFADSFGHEDYLIRAAKELPKVQFAHATGTKAHTEKLSNFHNAFSSIYEGRYVTGIAAGMKLNNMIEKGDIKKEEAKVGYIGAFPYAEVVSGYTAFFLGVRSVCDFVNMTVRYTNSWYDEKGEAKIAEQLIDEDKCKLISQHADSQGAPRVCENKGIPNSFYNIENKELTKSYLISTRINWYIYFKYFINHTLNGEAMGYDWIGNLSDGSIEVFPASSIAAPNTQEAIDRAIKDLKEGKLKVFNISTFTVGGQKITSYKADVDSDANFTGDTEVISDGYFHESEYRSSPYFDLRIDGIKEIIDDSEPSTPDGNNKIYIYLSLAFFILLLLFILIFV